MPEQWTTGVMIKLLEATHGQWLYRCVQVHDRVQGTIATQRKEELQREIEDEQEQGFDGLLEEDQYLEEVNLEDLENTSGNTKNTGWLQCKRHGRQVYFREVHKTGVAQRLHETGIWLHNSYLFNQGDRLSIASHSDTQWS